MIFYLVIQVIRVSGYQVVDIRLSGHQANTAEVALVFPDVLIY